jgi:hypothetical protein
MLGHEFDPVEARDLPVDLAASRRRVTAAEVTKPSHAPAVEGGKRDRVDITLGDVGLEGRPVEQHVTEGHCDGEARVQPVRRPVERPKEEIDGPPGFVTRMASRRTASRSVTCSKALNEQTRSNSAAAKGMSDASA